MSASFAGAQLLICVASAASVNRFHRENPPVGGQPASPQTKQGEPTMRIQTSDRHRLPPVLARRPGAPKPEPTLDHRGQPPVEVSVELADVYTRRQGVKDDHDQSER